MGTASKLPALRQAVEDVHRACKRARKPTALRNRLDFLKEREEAQLLGRNRSELTAHDLYDYVDECGGQLVHPELAYFIPRFCEIMADGENVSPPLGWICSLCCLEYSNFPSAWPDDQVEAIQRFVEALLIAYITDPAEFAEVQNIGELLGMAGKGGIDMDKLTAALGTADEQALARALAKWIDEECFLGVPGGSDLPKVWRNTLPDAFWHGREFERPVLEWLVGFEPWSMFAAAAAREADPAWRTRLNRVAKFCLEWPERPRDTPTA